jgi:NodT family efflux transporter outer membrane factor (OMF) lipoprotein
MGFRAIDRFAPLAASALAVVAGCTVGPDFETPQPPAEASYAAKPLPVEAAAAAASGSAPRFVPERDVPADWWTLFESPALDDLVRRALADSPRLEQAEAKLARALERSGARVDAIHLPRVDLGAATDRVEVDGDAFESELFGANFPLTLSTASLSVSYSLDLFGHGRRELEALRAAADHERFGLEAARLMLAGNVVAAAIEEASLREQIAAAGRALELGARRLEIVDRLQELGGVAAHDAMLQRSDLARTRAASVALERRLAQTRNRLAVYVGRSPGEAALPEIRLDDLHLPTELPLSLPSELARQRPDIRAAESLLHEASARVGVATANFYPRITLTGTGGAVAISPLLSGAAGFALLGASLAQPLFRGDELRAEKRAAVAAFDQAAASYREVVLAGLKEVADVLVAIDADARAFRESSEAARLARTAFEVRSAQYEAGGVSLLEFLEAEERTVTTSLDEVRATEERLLDSAALFQALGGGWWRAPAGTPGVREASRD